MLRNLFTLIASICIISTTIIGCKRNTEELSYLSGEEQNTIRNVISKLSFAVLEENQKSFVECFHPDKTSQLIAESLFDSHLSTLKFVRKLNQVYGDGTWEKFQEIKMYNYDVHLNISILNMVDVQDFYGKNAVIQHRSEKEAFWYSPDYGILALSEINGNWYILPEKTCDTDRVLQFTNTRNVGLNSLIDKIESPDYPLVELKKDFIFYLSPFDIDRSDLELKS